jgi:hypothetical protein
LHVHFYYTPFSHLSQQFFHILLGFIFVKKTGRKYGGRRAGALGPFRLAR